MCLIPGERVSTPHLSDDLVIEILECLPVRSLIRFRSVSKSWCNLIKSPDFINSHLLKQQKNSGALLVRRYTLDHHDDDVLSFYNLNSPELEELWQDLPVPNCIKLRTSFQFSADVRLLGPCNGLVCLALGDSVVLCNPALREFKQLPPCPFDSHLPPYPLSQFLGYGFGSACTNRFKIVHISTIYDECSQLHVQVYLYSSDTNSWRQIDYVCSGLFPYTIFYCFNSSVFFKRACHWHATTNDKGDNSRNVILSFDMNSEVFRQLKCPECSVQNFVVPTLMVLNDQYLSIVQCSVSYNEPQVFDVWVMTEYGVNESWTKQFVIGPDIIKRPLLSWKNGHFVLVETSNGQLASCAISTNEVERFPVYGKQNTLRALIYKESLISLK